MDTICFRKSFGSVKAFPAAFSMVTIEDVSKKSRIFPDFLNHFSSLQGERCPIFRMEIVLKCSF